MLRASKKLVADEWIGTQATIAACKQTLLGRANMSNEGYIPAEYVVTFAYEVNGRTFKGNYRANSPQQSGHTFEILYDSEHPARNTGSDVLQRSWIKIATWLLSGITILGAIWHWGEKNWFQW
jgi:hypothetical protein